MQHLTLQDFINHGGYIAFIISLLVSIFACTIIPLLIFVIILILCMYKIMAIEKKIDKLDVKSHAMGEELKEVNAFIEMCRDANAIEITELLGFANSCDLVSIYMTEVLAMGRDITHIEYLGLRDAYNAHGLEVLIQNK